MSFPYSGLAPGKRIALFGRSGVGKSYMSKWIVLRSTALRWIILDTKHDDIYDDWPTIDELPTTKILSELWQVSSQIVVRPKPYENNADTLDLWLEMIHEKYNRFGIVIDETYQVAFGPRAGPGLTGLVTRGRVRGQSVVMGSQRPAWVPRFVFSEANGYIVMSLNMREDKEKVASFVGDRWKRMVMRELREREWLWYDVGQNRLWPMRPVTILDVPVITPDGSQNDLTPAPAAA